jgi:hypothetical protein
MLSFFLNIMHMSPYGDNVIHQVALGWISSEPPKIEHFHVQNSEFRSSVGHKDQPFLHFHKKL